MRDARDTRGGEAASLTAGRNWDEHDKADRSMEHEWSAPRCRWSLSSDRRHRRVVRTQPVNARANGGYELLLDQGSGRGELATTRGGEGESLCIARGEGSTISRTTRVASARDRVTSPPRSRAGTASWKRARSAKQLARTQRRLRDATYEVADPLVIDEWLRRELASAVGTGSETGTAVNVAPLHMTVSTPRMAIS
jgi:hypothetical protein